MHYEKSAHTGNARTFRSFVRRNPGEQNYSDGERNYSEAPPASVPAGWHPNYLPVAVTPWMTRAAAANKRFAASLGWGLKAGSRFSGVGDPQLARVVSDFQNKVLRFAPSASDGQIGRTTLQAIIDWKARTSSSSDRGTVQYLANELSLPRSAGGGVSPGGGGGVSPGGGVASSGSSTALIAGLLAAAAGAVYFLG